MAATVTVKVTLIEQHKRGRNCLNTGYVSSKALIRSTRLLALFSRSTEFGIKNIKVVFKFADIMDRVQRTVKTVAPHNSIERYADLSLML